MSQPNRTSENPSSPSVQTSTEPAAQKAGRGGLALAGGKLFFLVAGLAQQIALKAVLGLGGYGALSTAQSWASINYNPVVQAGIQGVSRETAGASEEEQQLVLRRLLGFHLFFSVCFALLFFLTARPIANWLGAPHVTGGIQILSGIVLLYGLYAPLIGFLNGRRQFVPQALLDVTAATLRTVGLVAGAWAASQFLAGKHDTGVQVEGTVAGFLGAALLILLVALKMTGWGKSGGSSPPLKSYVLMIVPILFGQILLNILFQADALLLRKFASAAATSQGLGAAAADPYVGAYRATQLFCFLPFQLLTSVTFVLFPLLARAKSQGQDAEVARLIDRGLRLALIVAGLIVSVLVAVPGGLVTIVFGAEAAELGASAMRILAVGLGFFALLGVMTSALNSLGGEVKSFLLILAAVVLVVGLCFAFAQSAELSSLLLERVAAATTIAMLGATAAAAWTLRSLAGSHLSLLSLARTMLAVGVAGTTVAKLFPSGLLFTLVGAVSAGILFVGVLALTGELQRSDWNQIQTLVRR